MTRLSSLPLGGVILLAFVAAGCASDPPLCEGIPVPIDTDGWPDGGCDAEICDGLDNDCDNNVDEGYPDADNDGVAECTPEAEVCDGVDNDFDGQVDEGFPDYDRDGLADCADNECVLSDAAGSDLGGSPVCGGVPITHDADFWNPTVTLHYEGNGSPNKDFSQSRFTPLVAPLLDTTGDGVVDASDQPYVLMKSRTSVKVGDASSLFNAVLAIDPTDTSSVNDSQWLATAMTQYTGFAVGDLTNDGLPETVGVYVASGTTNYNIVATDNDGPTGSSGSSSYWKWKSADRPTIPEPDIIQPVIADLDGDGKAEVIVGDLIVNGEDGSTVTYLTLGESTPLTMPAVGDIDLDGQQELVIGPTVFRADGSEYWSQTRVLGAQGQFAAIVQADSDLEAEVIFIGAGRFAIYEHDGTVLAEANITSNNTTGPPCVADFDGDGVSEIAFIMNSVLWVRELDGSAVWDTDVSDVSGSAGCSGFDFDNDQSFELLVADEAAVSIFDGKTGATLWTETDHASETFFEYPTVADVDLDGSAEIIVASSNRLESTDTTAWTGLRIIEHPTGRWAPGTTNWQFHDFAYSNVTSNSQIPGPDNYYWDDWNLLRAVPGDPPVPDVYVEIVDVCESGCESFNPVYVTVQPFNQGSEDIDAGDLLLTIYGEDVNGLATPLVSEVYPNALPSMTAGASEELTFTYGDYVAANTVRLIAEVEIISGVGECDASNNQDVWPWLVCP